jgi:hypothetical protein
VLSGAVVVAVVVDTVIRVRLDTALQSGGDDSQSEARNKGDDESVAHQTSVRAPSGPVKRDGQTQTGSLDKQSETSAKVVDGGPEHEMKAVASWIAGDGPGTNWSMLDNITEHAEGHGPGSARTRPLLPPTSASSHQ